MKTNQVRLAKHGDLFCIPAGNNGYSCLGFDICQARTLAIANELRRPDLVPQAPRGTLESYAEYKRATTIAHDTYKRSGTRLQCELTPQLIGLEGCRVEVVDVHGTRRRFKVGKSTGWIPCHLELVNARSTSGGAVYGAPFKSVQVIK